MYISENGKKNNYYKYYNNSTSSEENFPYGRIFFSDCFVFKNQRQQHVRQRCYQKRVSLKGLANIGMQQLMHSTLRPTTRTKKTQILIRRTSGKKTIRWIIGII